MKFGLFAAGALAALGLVGTTSVARATTFTESATTNNGVMQTTDFSDTVTLAAFNTSLGTLTGVTVTLSDAGTFFGTVTNTAANNNSFKITEDVNLSASSSNTVVGGLTNDLVESQQYNNVPTGVPQQFAAPGGTPYMPTASSSASAVTQSDISEFIGHNISVVVSTLTGTSSLGGGGNEVTSINTQADATITITYTYTANPTGVPEPASVAVLGLGLLGLGFVRAKSSKTV